MDEHKIYDGNNAPDGKFLGKLPRLPMVNATFL